VTRPTRKQVSEAVARRSAERKAALKPLALPEGVQPLNPGFFERERMRIEARPRATGGKRKALQGKSK
jgi:hypothetical protein